uniref:KIAA1549 like n=1 Tax=Sus scrofa TaxID=9823 RepID=A0A8D0N0H0_PIG
MNGSSPNAQDLVSIPRLGLSGSSAPAEGPHAAGSPMPEFLSSVADLTPLSPPPLAPGSLLLLPGGTPSSSISEVAPSPASTQLSEAEVPARAHKAASLRAFRSTATRRAASSPVQTAASVVVEVTGRTSVPVTAHDSFHSLHLSAAPENSGGPSLSAEHTSPPLVPSPLPRATARPGQESLSGAVLASPSAGADFPSTPALLQPAHSQASPSALTPMPAPQEAGQDASPPAAATDFLLSSPVPTLPSTTGTFSPQEEDSMTAILKISKKAALTAALQTLPSQEGPSLRSESRLASDLSTDHVSRDITPPRRNLLPSAVHPSSLPLAQAPQTVSASLSFSSPKPETHTAAMDRSQWPVSASKQGTAFPSSSEVSDFSTMGDTKKPAITDVSWSSLSTQAGSLPAELTMSDVLQQTNYDVRGHTINSTSWGTHSASVTPPSGLNSSVNTIKFQDFKDNVGHSVTAGGSRFQDPDSGTGTSQAVQQSDASTVGNRTDFLSVSTDSHSRDFQMAGVEESESHPHLQLPAHPAHPLSLTSPSLTSAASWREMFSDGMDPSFQIAGDISPSLEINASTPFQNIPRDHSAAESPPLSSSALFRTPSKALLASQRPEKWTGAASHAVDASVSPRAEPTTAAATTLFLRKSSPPVLSAALVAKGPGSSPSAVASALVKSSWTTTLARNVTNNAAPGPKATPGAAHPAFSFTPTYMYARTAHAVSTHTAMQADMGAASGLLSTTHLPRKPQAMHTGFPNPTNPDMPRTSTARPLTITAALTSITAPVRATRMPPSSAENTDAALQAASTAMATTGKVASNLECQMSSKLLVKTVLFLTQRRVQVGETLKLSVAKGLTQALRKAFHQNDILAHVDILEHSHNVTVGYYATKGRLVYLPTVVIETLGVYGVSNVTADLKQHTPSLQSVALLAAPWNPQPAGYFQLKTVLQFVSQSDNIQSCKFAQTMEQRLQRAFQDAERKVLNTKSNLTIQMVSTSNASQTVTLVYVVGNRSSFLNGTVASSLLRQLSAELVGFYLTYPPLTIAEPLEYPNLDISETTRDYWVITMVKMQRVPGPKDPAELTYYTLYNGKPLLGTAAAKILSTIDSQRMALTLHHVVLLQADPVVKNPPNNLWIIAAVLAPIAVVTVIIIIITAVLCRKNKNDFKPDTMMNLPQRAKQVAQ